MNFKRRVWKRRDGIHMNLKDLRLNPYSKHVLERLEMRLDPNQQQIDENSITTQSGM